ncbi:hypothetical protein CEUSTIGMA_g2518.t1 [Chlamydomonas eustigma]|uniref:DUF7906 domain-containing protein n=1 Tax=Chlamydomonas eustigma TaxID=1157962 RepID=A0A250WW59_9CHLO|nr:hypothetical protein CEUSTIGMA_g2518.t1 [Chlamydomonas eustigma]|eukprot:GAX75074.1 hypothetical protein CEUSTIGMA_g2518.t1 [Chlamydomonas eustigma]
MGHLLLTSCFLFVCFSSLVFSALGEPENTTRPSPKLAHKKSKLTRSDGRRWDRMAEIVKTEIKSQTQKFLKDRDQTLSLILEVDILMLGFEGDGAFSYSFDNSEFENVMHSMTTEQKICPTVWETGEPSAVCFEINYVLLTPPEDALDNVERVIKANMVPRGNKTRDYVGVNHLEHKREEPVYEVDASGSVESTLYDILVQAYQMDNIPLPLGAQASKDLAIRRLSVIIINPHKIRMNPHLNPTEVLKLQQEHLDVANEWKQGTIHEQKLLDHEGDYSYRYSYMGRGASATWVSSHNFVVIDISAGPVTFGPLATPGGQLEPPAIPRLLPMLMRMTKDLEHAGHGVTSTLRFHMLAQAEEGQHAIFMGQLATVVAGATKYLFAPDLRFKRLEHARQVLVPIMVLHDEGAVDPLSSDTPLYRQVNLVQIQRSMDELMDHSQEIFVESTSSRYLTDFPAIAAAIHKSKVSRSDAVVMKEPDLGLHMTEHVHLDSEILLKELLMAIPDLSGGSLYVEDDEEVEAKMKGGISQYARHDGTRVLPVFVLALKCAPDQMMLDNKQMVAANHDAVVVLQLVKDEDDASTDDSGRILSGHAVDGEKLLIDSAGGVTTNVIAGLIMGLAGVVPPYERHDGHEGTVIQDWRWSMGALPWGPHSHFSELSGIVKAVAKRNFFISHVELAVHAVHARLERLDSLIASTMANPLAYLFDESIETNRMDLHIHHNEDRDNNIALHKDILLNPKKYFLDHLASQSLFPTTTNSTIEALETKLREVELKLEILSWALYSQSWEEAEQALQALMATVDAFTELADADLEVAEDASECCKLHHDTSIRVRTMVLLVLAALAMPFVFLFTIVMCCTEAEPPRGRAGSYYNVGTGRSKAPGTYDPYRPSGSVNSSSSMSSYGAQPRSPPGSGMSNSKQTRAGGRGGGGLFGWLMGGGKRDKVALPVWDKGRKSGSRVGV